MVFISSGLLLIVIGALSIRFPQLVKTLRQQDQFQWQQLGSPPEFAFSKTIGVYAWVLDHGYESSNSETIKHLGESALKRALFAKYALLFGATLICLGFVMALL